ncbi:ABC transporter F family member 4-like isoform X2 [Aricia agestis]|uniref:ABC transporter F family member 4-like isoform X2 n=1 Tax=Aricia agestis TaxID=91739 RepID=UPI001C20C2C7|nr:ABC transporter F family member 4-like isoform X2 [Aricia agestis]
MELLSQVSQTQILFPAAAVAVVLVCAALVFMFGFHTAEQPQFDKLSLVLDDRKSSNKKRKGIKEKKSSPNRVTSDDSKSKNEAKKSPAKEKKEEKVKEAEKPKPKEKVEPKAAKKPEVQAEKKGKKKAGTELDKPADFDDGVWEEVPKKSDKKKVKGPEEKKDSPTKTNKKKNKNVEAEVKPAPQEAEVETIKVVSAVGPDVDEDATRALQAQVEELQRVLKEAERRDKVLAGLVDEEEEEAAAAELTDVKDLRSNKKKENKEKQKKKEVPAPAKQEDKEANASTEAQEQAGPVFDELGDTWADAKVSKKSKKKARKDQ